MNMKTKMGYEKTQNPSIIVKINFYFPIQCLQTPLPPLFH